MLPLFCPLAFFGLALLVGLYVPLPLLALGRTLPSSLLLPVPAAPLPAAPGPVVGRGGDGAAVGDGGSAVSVRCARRRCVCVCVSQPLCESMSPPGPSPPLRAW
eukprot:2797353-Alexandrium_andersonii.AAC.2